MTSRNLACVVASEVDATLAAILREGDWRSETLNVSTAGSPDATFEACDAGVVCIGSSSATDIARLRRAVASNDRIGWVAVVCAGLIEHELVREFVAAQCIDYQTIPLDRHRFLAALGHVAGMTRLAARDNAQSPSSAVADSIIGNSPAIRSLRRNLAKIAAVAAPVLITGESGTGKELVARAIHELSERRDQALVAVNCVALAPSLIHSELFGFEKGAFTGAHQRTIGYLEAARGGSVFLDEIGDLHPELQGLLLRFFDEQSVRRLGGREAISIDARVIAATNVDLETAVRDKRFREDLYHRLNVLRLHLPPLRERPEDIDALSHSLLERYARDSPGRLRGFSKAAMMALRSHAWPGNVRELVNRVRHAVVMADGRQITPEDLRLGVVSGDQPLARLDVARLAAERHTILEALRRTGWNACKSAELIGVSRATFYRLLDRHGLKAEDA